MPKAGPKTVKGLEKLARSKAVYTAVLPNEAVSCETAEEFIHYLQGRAKVILDDIGASTIDKGRGFDRLVQVLNSVGIIVDQPDSGDEKEEVE